MKIISVLLANATPLPGDGFSLTVTEVLIIALLIFAAVLLFVTIILFNAFKVTLRERNNLKPYQKYEDPAPLNYEDWLKQKKGKPSIWVKLLSLKPIEKEEELIIPHAYDGIHELNNPVPTWFNVLFYGTMIFAAGYLYYYHIGEYGPKQDQEYENEMAKAITDKIAFLAKSGEKYDENSVKIDPALVVNGKQVFANNCKACHGEHGEGIIGPNLTDAYWLHGGSINEIFKTIKYGVPAKGMVSWEKNLSAKNIAELSNYILTLKGTNPINAKAPQGDLYKEESVKDTVENGNNTKK
ncbi:cbb3-type cytochrome c oxidase N-terminal domain-containing protein [Pedobacter sp. Du54]|uniref:cbb3-type cytochrome c oxidase N-terminal domain-containing protein n=1 Tax=Pedobacter anseongensis TaxID=3133439 RepID=UPI0030B583A4